MHASIGSGVAAPGIEGESIPCGSNLEQIEQWHLCFTIVGSNLSRDTKVPNHADDAIESTDTVRGTDEAYQVSTGLYVY